MPLVSEQTRLLQDEEVILSETSQYSRNTVHDWEDRKTVALSLTKKQFVYVEFDVEGQAGVKGAGRLIVTYNSTTKLVAASGKVEAETVSRKVLFILDTEDYTLHFQSACWVTGGNLIRIKNLRVAITNFVDKSDEYYSGSQSVNNDAEQNVISQNITVPSARKTCIGTIQKYTILVIGYFYVDAVRRNKINIVSAADYVVWRLYKDDSYLSAITSSEDTGIDTSNISYGEGCFGRWATAADPGDTVNIKIKAYNRTGATRTCKAEIFVILCPWILPYGVPTKPVALDFPQGSTLYVTAEPLTTDPTKYVRIGCERIADLSADYYKTSSGTGILEFNYRFEVVEVDKVDLEVEGYGGCISVIGVDIR